MSGRLSLALFLLVSWLSSSSAHADAQPPTKCEIGKTLLEAGFLDDAKAAYKEALGDEATKGCGVEGLKEHTHLANKQKKDESEKHCARGDSLSQANLLTEARAAYQDALKANAAAPCAITGLTKLDGVQSACARGAALREKELLEEAKASYQEALKVDAKAPCALQGLKDLAPAPPEPSLWERLEKGITEPYLTTPTKALSKFLFGLMGLLVVPLGLVLALYALLSRWGPSQRFANWLMSSVRLRHLLLDVDKLEDPADANDSGGTCKQLLIRLESELLQLRQTTVMRQPSVIEGSVTELNLPELKSVPDEVNQLWSFIQKLFPAQRITLSGILRFDEKKGAGIQLKLVHDPTKELWGAQVIWQKDLDPSYAGGKTTPGVEVYATLLTAVAAWSMWTLHEREHHPGSSCATRKCNKLRNAYGTDSWRSHVTVQQGRSLLKEQAGAPGARPAERFFLRALDRDPRNWQALLGLADTKLQLLLEDEHRRKDPAAYRPIKACLDAVKTLSPRKLSFWSRAMNPAHVTANFNLGAVLMYRRLLTGVDIQESDNATASVLLDQAKQGAQRSRQFTDIARDTLNVAYAVAMRLEGKDQLVNHTIQELETSPWLPASIRYNLACYYSSSCGEQEPSSKDLATARGHLEEAIALREEYRAQAQMDPSLQALLVWSSTQTKNPLPLSKVA